METDPHAVVEGVALAAYAVGATHAVRRACAATRPSPSTRCAAAHAPTRRRPAILGADALGTGIELHIEVASCTGAFVVGEETVLLRAIEDKRAQPDQRPPYPAEQGLWGEPTVVNNVETLAAVPWIVRQRRRRLRRHSATADEPGTTLVQLTGAVSEPGIVEVPTGTPAAGRSSKPRRRRHRHAQGRPGRRPVGRLPAGRRRSTRRYRHGGAGTRPARIVGLGHRRWSSTRHLHRRPGHAADALPERRVVRQDHPLSHRHPAAGRARRRASAPAAARPTDAAAAVATSRPTSGTARCAASSHGASTRS